MTQAPHTPGPWRIFAPFGLERAEIVTDRATADETESIISFDGEENTEANARLIAAAPDLLEALEFFFNIMHDFESSRRKGYVTFALNQARAALAKAKGGAA